MNDSMLREQNKRTVVTALWVVLICCVVVGSLLPATSPPRDGAGRSFAHQRQGTALLRLRGALVVAWIGFRDRRRGIVAGLSIFILGLILEDGQHFSPSHAVELGDVIANGAGGSCGVLLAPPIRMQIAIL